MIGGFRHRVKIQEETATADEGGGYSRTWTDVDTMWCSIEPVNPREVFQANQIQARVTHKILTRYRTDVSSANRLLFGTRAFNIRSVTTKNERSRLTVILAEEGAPT